LIENSCSFPPYILDKVLDFSKNKSKEEIKILLFIRRKKQRKKLIGNSIEHEEEKV